MPFRPARSSVEIAGGLTFSIILLSVCANGTPIQASNASDKRDYEEAMRLEALGHYGESSPNIARSPASSPEGCVRASAELAGAYMNNYNDIRGGIEKAEECLRRAIQLDPECGKAYSRMAEIYDTRGDYLAGHQICNQVHQF